MNSGGPRSASVSASAALFLASYGVIGLHETGHAVTAALQGAQVHMVHLHALGGRTIFLFPPSVQSWKVGVTLIAGAFATLIAAIASIASSTRHVSDLRFHSLFLQYFGLLAALATVFSVGIPASRTFNGEALAGLRDCGLRSGWANITVAILSVISICATIVLGKRFATLMRSVAGCSSFLAFSVFLAVPVLTLICLRSFMAAMGSDYTLRPPQFMIAALISAALASFLWWALGTAAPREGLNEDSSPIIEGLASRARLSSILILAVLAIQFSLFGRDSASPKGIIFSPVRETAVRGCNVRIVASSMLQAQVSLAMRPFSPSQEFLWQSVRSHEPEDWQVYEEFARENIPILLHVASLSLIAKRTDLTTPFFTAFSKGVGSRSIEARVELHPASDDSRGQKTLRVRDFWRTSGIGFIDKIEFDAPAGWTIVETHPAASYRDRYLRISPMGDKVTLLNVNLESAVSDLEVVLRESHNGE
jgi:hypothetical protein